VRYADGRGVPRDDAQAVNWWRQAAEQGNDEAQLNLGVAYAKGSGVAPDFARAVEWWRRSAAQGNPGAQFNLGLSYRDGRGVLRNEAEALRWIGLACERLTGTEQRTCVAVAAGLRTRKD
jgi:TPR repeat protein